MPAALPDEFTKHNAEAGDRVTDADGTTWVVLVDHRDKSRKLVREDVVAYEQLDHPVLTGAAGFMATLLALVAPLLVAFTQLPSFGLHVDVAIRLASVGIGWLASRVVLFYTPIGDEVFRFMEWNDHKELIEGRDLTC